MAACPDTLDKIRSTELREEVLAADDVLRTVLVEIDVARPRMERTSRPSLTPGRASLRIVAGNAGEAQERQVRQAIEAALGRATERYLASAHAFVVKATGRELRAVAELPAVLAIWPNTRRPRIQAG